MTIPTADLHTLSDTDLTKVIAEEVVGKWRHLTLYVDTWVGFYGDNEHSDEVPDYVTDANAALELLHGREWNAWTQGQPGKPDFRVYVGVYPTKKEHGYVPVCAPSFARAVCLALISTVRSAK